MFNGNRVNVVIPALNEAPSISRVVTGLWQLRHDRQPLVDEVVVCDNGSDDQTTALALAAGARVVHEPVPGYGRACQRAIAALNEPDFIVFVDGDYSVYSQQLPLLLTALDHGVDLAIGSRTMGHAEPGSMTFPQRFGNRLATLLIRLCWRRHVSDLGPFRAIKSSALTELDMQDNTFGWTIEMQIKAIQKRLVTAELPVDTRRRIGQSKISGTVSGTIGAGVGIIGKIIHLRRMEQNASQNHRTLPTTTGFKV